MPWKDIFSHSIHYATFGIPVHQRVAHDWSINKTKLSNDPDTSQLFLKMEMFIDPVTTL